MVTRNPYDYHVQFTLLTQAQDALKKAEGFLNQALNAEIAQLGPKEANSGEYGELSRLIDNLRACVADHANAVQVLANHSEKALVKSLRDCGGGGVTTRMYPDDPFR